MRACIFLNGQISDYDLIKQKVKNYDLIICCDGGANHMYKLGLVPNYIVGDLDSINEEVLEYYKKKNVEFRKFNKEKDETDMQLATILAKKIGAKSIDFFSSLGGRIDHTLANINFLYYVKSLGIQTKIISEYEEIFILVNEYKEFDFGIGQVVSVIPIENSKVTLKGFKYPLDNYEMKFYLPLGVSNEVSEEKNSINVDGSVLLIRQIGL